MFDLFKFLGREQSSKNVAKDRLKLVLVHDRTNCSPELLELVKGDLLDALSSYIEIDEIGFEIKITKTQEGPDGKPALIASIPIKNMKRA